jgi:hypothetical protein
MIPAGGCDGIRRPELTFKRKCRCHLAFPNAEADQGPLESYKMSGP